MKKRILHLIYNLGLGGTEKMMLNTLPYLNDFEHLICVINFVDKDIAQEFFANKIEVIKLKGLKIFHFRKIIKKEKPELLITYLIYADIFGRIFGKLFGIKKVITSIRSTYNEKKYKIWLFLEKLSSFLVDHYIAVSYSVKNVYHQVLKIPEEKIIVIYNGVDLKKFENLPPKEVIKKSLGLANFHPLIGYVSKLRKEKNHPVLIQAFSLIVKKYPDAGLLLIGDGPEKKVLLQMVKNLNLAKNVFFLGNRKDIPEILKILDVFVSVSKYEGMSNAILEAMATGLPIIASDVPSNQELIENKKDGLLVPSYDIQKVAKSIKEILENPDLARIFFQNTSKKIQLFSIKKAVNKLNYLLCQILKI